MQHRLSERARTDFSVEARQGILISRCRGIEVSATGILIDRGRPIADRDSRIYVNMEIRLPERLSPLRAVARPVWAFGTQQAFKFVVMSDVDRLSLAEHVDLMHKRRKALYPSDSPSRRARLEPVPTIRLGDRAARPSGRLN